MTAPGKERTTKGITYTLLVSCLIQKPSLKAVQTMEPEFGI